MEKGNRTTGYDFRTDKEEILAGSVGTNLEV